MREFLSLFFRGNLSWNQFQGYLAVTVTRIPTNLGCCEKRYFIYCNCKYAGCTGSELLFDREISNTKELNSELRSNQLHKSQPGKNWNVSLVTARSYELNTLKTNQLRIIFDLHFINLRKTLIRLISKDRQFPRRHINTLIFYASTRCN